MCWYKLQVKPPTKDWIISVSFFKFKIGRLVNATTCLDGYIQIIDGNEMNSDLTSRQTNSYFCGESDHRNIFISESNQVKVVFYVEHFTEETYFAFDTRAGQQYQLFARHGPNPELYPGRRGHMIRGTYCDRIFESCRLGTCYIQSPGYPGVYPRNLRCKYYVKTALKHIRLHTENELIDIDGQRCADLILCPAHPVTAKHCPYDRVQIYDGLSEDSPLIGVFCGRGKFPYSIIGSGRELLLIFVSSPAGPLLSTGFSFHVGPFSKWEGPGATIENGSCDAVFHSSSRLPDAERRFHSLTTWYPPNTKCSFTILGEPHEVIRLRFKTFRVSAQQHAIVPSGECSETLTIYDSHTRDDSKLVTTFCDTWSSPATELDHFVSSGPAMYVQFTSLSGSYFESSLDYWILFDFFNAFRYGVAVEQSQCDETFTTATSTTYASPNKSPLHFSSTASTTPSTARTTQSSTSATLVAAASSTVTFLRHGIFSSPLNNLVFLTKRQLNCRYRFDAGANVYARVLIAFVLINFTTTSQQCISCLEDSADKILIVDRHANGTDRYCICESSLQSGIDPKSPLTFLSEGPRMEVALSVDQKFTERYFKRVDAPIFRGIYEFLHGFGCGPPILNVQNQGELLFPDPAKDYYEGGSNSVTVRCVWTILVSMRKDVYLRFEHVAIDKNCSTDRIDVRIPDKKHSYGKDVYQTVCGTEQKLDFPIISSSSLTSNRILIEFRSLQVAEQSFKLVWTELSQVEHHSKFTMEAAAAASTDCSFVCKGSNTCIPQDLVCNGVRNCPIGANAESASDEDIQMCKREENGVNWLAIGLGAAGGAIFALCCILLIHKCCKKCHDSDPG